MHRQIRLHPGEVFPLLVFHHAVKHLAIELNGRVKATVGIGHIGIDHLIVGCDPVEGRTVGVKRAVIGAEDHALQDLAGGMVAPAPRLLATERPPHGQKSQTLPAGAGEQHTRQRVMVRIEVRAHEEGAHGMA